MRLLTSKIEEQLPSLYTHEETPAKNVKIIAKFFNAFGAGTWYATEYDPVDKLFFGYAEISAGCGELGYFSLDELESLEKRQGLPMIERDIHFGEHFLQEIIDGGRP